MATRVVWSVIITSIAVTLLVTLGFVVATLPARIPYWGEVETLFEASRLREHLPLFTDPLMGAREHGLPPARFYVTYPPLWTWVVSRMPGGVALIMARVASTTAWFGTLAWLAIGAPNETRRHASLAAGFVAGIWILANFAMVGRPDSVALALAAIGLARAVRLGRMEPLSVLLLVTAAWVKPTVIGLPAGAIVGGYIADRRSGLRMIGLAIGLALGSAAVAHVASNGALFAHVVRSNAQPLSLAAWIEHVPTRLPWFGPLLVWAAVLGWRARAHHGARIGLAALAGATEWTLMALAKTGSSSNYWMEPAMAAVVLVARVPTTAWIWGLRTSLVALATVLMVDVASVRSALEHAIHMREDAAFVSSLRLRLGLAPSDVIAADEAGVEFMLNGRILTPTYQMVHLVLAGRYPSSLWTEDLGAPQTRAFVEHTGQLRLAPVLQQALEAQYMLAFEQAGFRVWKRR